MRLLPSHRSWRSLLLNRRRRTTCPVVVRTWKARLEASASRLPLGDQVDHGHHVPWRIRPNWTLNRRCPASSYTEIACRASTAVPPVLSANRPRADQVPERSPLARTRHSLRPAGATATARYELAPLVDWVTSTRPSGDQP